LQETQGLQDSLSRRHEYVDITPFACQKGLHITGTTVVQVVVALQRDKGEEEEYWTRTFDAANPKICEAFLLKPLLSPQDLEDTLNTLKMGRASPTVHILARTGTNERAVVVDLDGRVKPPGYEDDDDEQSERGRQSKERARKAFLHELARKLKLHYTRVARSEVAPILESVTREWRRRAPL